MKRIILILLIGMFLINLVWAEECEIATPRYGVIQCMNTNQKETQTNLFGDFDGEWSINKIECLSNCQLMSAEDISIFCEGPPWDVSEVWKEEAQKENFPIAWNRGEELIVKGKCTTLFNDVAVPADSYVEFQQDKIMLYEGWAGSLPNKPIDGSENCVLNKNLDTSNIDYYLDPSTEKTENKLPSTYPSLNEFPENWKINDNLVFIKDWQTGIADISLTYDKDNNAYWCGGQYGSRKIYSVKEVISSTGKCYSVPQSIYLSNIECCFSSDCVNEFGAEYTCNPDNWKCEKTRPCNSQLECDSVFGEGVCQDNKINQWVCDLTKKWGNYAGTCVHSSKQVSECPSDCSSKEYYNEEQGKCLPRAGLKDEDTNESSITSAATGTSRTGSIIVVVFLILIGGSIGYFIYNKNKGTKLKQQVKKDVEVSGKYCKKCGSLLRGGSKFCGKCGKRI